MQPLTGANNPNGGKTKATRRARVKVTQLMDMEDPDLRKVMSGGVTKPSGATLLY